jgi:hypothetical protein
MRSKLILLLIAAAFTLGMWSCKDQPPVTPDQQPPQPGVSHISGSVYDIYTNNLISNAAVYLTTSNRVDSFYTSTDGEFRFEVDRSKIQNTNATLVTHKMGYVTDSRNISVAKDTILSVGLGIDVSTLAIITGTVRDSSAYLYPLRNATVLLTVPGYVDSVVTLKEGTFRLLADLIDRDSVQVKLTIYKLGYRTYQKTFTIYKGYTKDLGDVLLGVDQASTVAQVLGRVFDAQSRLPLNNATVTLVSSLLTDSVATSYGGEYSFSINLQGLPSISGLLKIARTGYKPQSASFNAEAGKLSSQDFYLIRDTVTSIRDTSKSALYAHSIAFVGMTSREISVYGVGGTESTILTWEVRDSLGFPIDIDHRDTVEFILMGTPTDTTNGNYAAYVSPSKAITNASGRIATTVNSGTISGVLQFIAKIHRETDGFWIISTPVIITVNAGLPDQSHFTIGADLFNFPGYDWVNNTDGILVQVGDKYSNPVKLGTAVYFNTTGGVIDASGFTDRFSHAKVTLYSGKPLPKTSGLDPSYYGDGTGYARIRAYTLGENSVPISDSILILFSGVPKIEVVSPYPYPMPDSFEVPSRSSSGTIHFKVTDENGNPLSGGTHIAVTLQYTPPPLTDYNFRTTGDVDVTLDDVRERGPGSTEFSFEVVDQTITVPTVRIPATVIISVTGPNGKRSIQIKGHMGG